MADRDFTTGGTLFPSRHSNVKVPVLLDLEIDLADSTITASDVLQVLEVPAGSVVLAAGFQVLTEITGTTADATGTAQVGSTAFSGALDLDAAAAGAYATGVDAVAVVATADTVDVVLNAFTGTITGGTLRVWALITDIMAATRNTIAQLGS